MIKEICKKDKSRRKKTEKKKAFMDVKNPTGQGLRKNIFVNPININCF
jgi:hypothetical protein